MKFFAKVTIHDGVAMTIPLTDENVFTVCPHTGETMRFPLLSYLEQHNVQTSGHQEMSDDEEEALDIAALLDVLCDGAELLRYLVLEAEGNNGHQQV